MIVHTNDLIQYTISGDYCGVHFNNPGTCEDAITRTDKDEETPAVIWLLAAFPDTSSPAVTTIQFGIDHNLPAEEGYFAKSKMCADLEMPDAGWPETGFGNLVSFGSSAHTELLFPYYFFAAYGFEGAYFGTTVYPSTEEAKFVDDSEPPVEDLVTRFGTVRWYATGSNDCPSAGGGEDDLPDGPGEEDLPDDPDGDGGDEDGMLTDVLSVAIVGQPFVFDANETDEVSIERIEFLDEALATRLAALGGLTIAKAFPGTTPADTLGWATDGSRVRLADLSRFYEIRFPTSAAAVEAGTTLEGLPAIRSARVLSGSKLTGTPNDEYFLQWPPGCSSNCLADPQWFLRNLGLRQGQNNCPDASPGNDVQIESSVYWPFPSDESHDDILIGIIDGGVWDSHEDLDVVPLDSTEAALLQHHPDDDCYGEHGTKMAGLAAAKTDNVTGVAGVCDGCRILDIEAAHPLLCSCVPHESCTPVGWYDNLNAAVSLFKDRGLRAVNMSFVGTGLFPAIPAEVQALWNAHAQGVACAASAGNEAGVNGLLPPPPASVPSVLGIGGFTHDGRLWDPNTSCYGDGNGTYVSQALDVCAPSSPEAITPNPIAEYGDHYYSRSKLETSGAAALASGAIGWLQLYASASWWGANKVTLSADDAIGLLTGTALPFTQDPHLHSPCTICTDREFGRGRLNLQGAMDVLVDAFLNRNRDGHFQRKVARAGDPGFTIEEMREFIVGGEVWKEYRVRAIVDLACTDSGDLPEVVAWPNRYGHEEGLTTTLVRYGLGDADRLENAAAGVSDVSMWIGPRAELIGWNYARVTQGGLEYLVEREDLAMAYSTYSTAPCDLSASYEVATPAGAPVLSVTPSIGQPPVSMRWNMVEPGHCMIEIVDVSGRIVRRLVNEESERGWHTMVWDGNDDGGRGVAGGVYWVRSRLSGVSQASKMVVLH